MPISKAAGKARARAFRDADQELTAWLNAKFAEIDASHPQPEEKNAAGRLLIFKDLGRRAEQRIEQICQEHD